MLLKINTTGSAVANWQNFLIQQGFLDDVADGYFGPKTKSATIAFQQNKGLMADGIVGNDTLAKAAEDGYHASAPVHAGFPPANTIDAVFDISHLNGPYNTSHFSAAKAAGMIGVFHKALEGFDYKDGKYADRKTDAIDAGLLWGAYHFGHHEDGAKQADNFIDIIGTNGDVLPALDYETPPNSPPMSVAQVEAFVQRVKERTGKYPGLYLGPAMRKKLSESEQPILSKCWIWLAEYRSTVIKPNGWGSWQFWQYTDGTHGPAPAPLAGMGTVDRDLYNGTNAELRAFWAANAV